LPAPKHYKKIELNSLKINNLERGK